MSPIQQRGTAMRRALILVLGLVVVMACGREDTTGPAVSDIPSAAAAAAANSWVSQADYPTDVWDAASASVTDPVTGQTMLYVIGGLPRRFGGAGSILSAVKAYDVESNSWRGKASYPVRVEGTNGAVEIGGEIYVSGGFTRRFDEQHGVWRREVLR